MYVSDVVDVVGAVLAASRAVAVVAVGVAVAWDSVTDVEREFGLLAEAVGPNQGKSIRGIRQGTWVRGGVASTFAEGCLRVCRCT